MNKLQAKFNFLIAVFIFLLSCKSSGPIVNIPLEYKNESVLLEHMRANEYQFETINGKASVTIENKGKKNSIKANIRMRKDSALWINFSYIGFAGARVLITQDSVKIINYKDEQYIITDLEYINKRFNLDVDFETIQSLLIGNSVAFEEDEKLKTSIDNDRYFLSSMRKGKFKRGLPEKRLDKLERKQEKNPDRQRYSKKQERKEEKYAEDVYSIWLDKSTNKIVKTMVKDFIHDIELIVDYNDFREDENQLFPHEVKLVINASDTSKVEINYSKIIRNKPVKFTFNIPEKYVQIKE